MKKKEGLAPLFACYSLIRKSASLLRKERQEGEFVIPLPPYTPPPFKIG
jgi:hypothetical protein